MRHALCPQPACMLRRCPKLVAGKVALLMGHLAGRAYSLRSGIVTALGHLVVKAFDNVPGEDADAQGTRSPHQRPGIS